MMFFVKFNRSQKMRFKFLIILFLLLMTVIKSCDVFYVLMS